jgi:hypothetical protein
MRTSINPRWWPFVSMIAETGGNWTAIQTASDAKSAEICLWVCSIHSLAN